MQRTLMWVAAAAALAIAGALVFAPRGASGPPATDPGAAIDRNIGVDIGQTAPDFTLPGLDGSLVSLSDLRGQVVLIDFWSDWCPYCTEEFPAMQKVYDEFRGRGFVVLAVHRSRTETRATAERFVLDTGVTFPVLLDEGDVIYQRFVRVPAMPATVFIGRDGVIIDRIFGPKDLESLRDRVESLL